MRLGPYYIFNVSYVLLNITYPQSVSCIYE